MHKNSPKIDLFVDHLTVDNVPLTPKQGNQGNVKTTTVVEPKNKGKEKIVEFEEVEQVDASENDWSDASDSKDPNYGRSETEDSDSVYSLDTEHLETDDELKSIRKMSKNFKNDMKTAMAYKQTHVPENYLMSLTMVIKA